MTGVESKHEPQAIAKSILHVDDGVYVPVTATQVKVTNVIDPYHLRILDTESYDAAIVQLEGKLHQLAKTELQEYGDGMEPEIGDMVLIDNRNSFNVDLPAWCCRGIVGSKKNVDSKYRVFLPDHGIALNLWMENLRILPPDSVLNDFLTSSVGINDVVPIDLVNSIACVSEKWSNIAVRFTREIITAATHTFFDHLTSDKSGNKFGELYLIVDGEIVALSKALVLNQFARVINGRLIEMIENREMKHKMCNGSISVVEKSCEENKENNTDSDKSDDDKRQNKSTAIYTRALDGSLKTNRRDNVEHEILICSKVQCEQLTSLADARFPAQIHSALHSLSIMRPMRLQEYVWPAVTKGLNVVVVASHKAGKTMSYLVPVVSAIAANETYTKVPGVNGPLALILCVSSLDVHEVHEKCAELLNKYQNVNILEAYNGISEQYVVAKIYNGCEILISTPPYLTRLIRNNRNLLNFMRLSHMIFDGADVILEKYQASLGEIFKIPEAARNGRRESPGAMPLQMIAVARHWTSSLRKLVDGFIEDPYVCIASYMEAAVYAALKTKLIFLPKEQKAAKVVELLGVQWPMLRTMIVCTTTMEVMDLVEVLKSNCIDTVVVHDEMIFTAIRGIKETWMTRVSGKYFVLVCTDQVVADLNIKNVECLIHYSLATTKKTQFFQRFSTLTNNFYRRVHGKERLKPRFILMADETNDTQLNGVVTVMRRLNIEIPQAMETYLEKIFTSVEMAKTDRCLCKNLKAFGYCYRRETCTSRHSIVPEVDQPITGIRTGDCVKFVLTGRHSANHYCARIIEYITANSNKRVPFSFQEFTDLPVKMQKHYADPANRRSSKSVSVGHICAIEETPGNFKRVQILSAVGKDALNTQNVNVRCVDDGDIFPMKACQLLEIPEDLAKWPSHIVDVYLTGVIPYDNEPAWSPCADKVVCKWFEEKLAHPTSSTYGKVLLHLSHILWVDPLEVRHKLQQGYPDLVDSSLKATLIDAKCGMENKQHIVNLLNLCEISKVTTNLATTTPTSTNETDIAKSGA